MKVALKLLVMLYVKVCLAITSFFHCTSFVVSPTNSMEFQGRNSTHSRAHSKTRRIQYVAEEAGNMYTYYSEILCFERLAGERRARRHRPRG